MLREIPHSNARKQAACLPLNVMQGKLLDLLAVLCNAYTPAVQTLYGSVLTLAKAVYDESRLNTGVTFLITPPPGLRSKEPMQHLHRIAIVEDHDDSREFLCLVLRDHFSVRDFKTASDFLTAVDQEQFDVILTDIRLPDMDGYALLSSLHRRRGQQSPPFIALTAAAMVGDREKALLAGFTDYLVKPIDLLHVITAIEKCLGTKSKGKASSD